MKWKCIATGSDGNCYTLSAGGETLIIEAGVPIGVIKRALNFDFSHVVGCFISHTHKDHSKAEADLIIHGIPVMSPYANGRQKSTFGGFTVTAFPLPHDGVPNYGALIRHGDFTMLYMTDMEYSPYTFATHNVNAMLIECNYCDDLVSGDEKKYEHSLLGHCSLETAKGIVAANKTEDLRTVILCHLSNGWSDEKRMVDEIKSVVVPEVSVYAATAGEEYEI